MVLERELETFKRALPSLMLHKGKFALIHDDQVVGTYSTWQEAADAGYRFCGLLPFLVQQILGEEKEKEIRTFFDPGLVRCPKS